MEECIEDFLGKVNAYESDEELYEESDVDAPYPPDYGSEEYDYPTKAKAKAACKEAVKSALEDMLNTYGEQRDNIISYAEDYFGGLGELLQGFVGEFLESYDEYASIECEGQAQEYVLGKKAVLFEQKELQKEIETSRIKGKIEALRNEVFDAPIKKLMDIKEYFAICTYDKDDECYCFNMEDACEKMSAVMQEFLGDVQTTFPEEIEEVYESFANDFCEMLKNRLAEL